MSDRKIFVIYCDDIRNEVGNKQSWMGIYSGELIVPKLPTALPKLCAAITVITPAEIPFGRLKLCALLNGEVVYEIDLPEEGLMTQRELARDNSDDDGKRHFACFAAMAIVPFPIEKPSVFQVVAETEIEGELLKGRKLKVREATPTEGRAPRA